MTEPSTNIVSRSTGSGLSTLVTPWQAYISWPLAHTPTATPGIPNFVAVASTNSASVSCAISVPSVTTT